jgi:hypothetical protein
VKKISTLFKREHDGDPSWRGPRPCNQEIRPGCEWVLEGKGVATEKIDGTACLLRDGKLWRRQARKPTKAVKKKLAKLVHASYEDPELINHVWNESHYNPAPDGWEPCGEPAQRTGLWFGWIPINGDDPADKWHVEGFDWLVQEALKLREATETKPIPVCVEGTYELVGPKVEGNKYLFDSNESHELWRHGKRKLYDAVPAGQPRTYVSIVQILKQHDLAEGVVFHYQDGDVLRMAKLKRKDVGLPWPVPAVKKLEAELAKVNG